MLTLYYKDGRIIQFKNVLHVDEAIEILSIIKMISVSGFYKQLAEKMFKLEIPADIAYFTGNLMENILLNL